MTDIPGMTTQALIEARLQAQIDSLETAIVKARRNELSDMRLIDREIALLCRQISSYEKDTVQPLEPKMIEMITKLDELEGEIRDYKERVKR